MDIRLALISGIDIPIPECQLVLHQPRIKEIAYIGEQDFFIGVQTLNIDKRIVLQDKALLAKTNNFQIFMRIMTDKETLDKKKNVISVLQLLFPDYKAMITPRTLIFSKENTIINIDESNFNFLQQAIAEIFCLNSTLTGQNGSFNPADDRAAEIARKLMKARERVAIQQKDGGSGSMFAQYMSVLSIGAYSMSLKDCLDLTMYQLLDLYQRYMLYIDWDLDIRSRLAGGKPDKQPENWMKNIH